MDRGELSIDEKQERTHFKYAQEEFKKSPSKLSKFLNTDGTTPQKPSNEGKPFDVENLQAIRKKMQRDFDNKLDS